MRLLRNKYNFIKIFNSYGFTILATIFLFLPHFAFAEKKGSLETLILSWTASKTACDLETNTFMKENHCNTQFKYEKILNSKGLCKGAYTFKLENDGEIENSSFKEQYQILEKILRNKWVPCIFEVLLENKQEALNFDQIEESHWLEANEDGSFNLSINKLLHHQYSAYYGCRGGGNDIEKVIGDCRMREELVFLLIQVGLCPCGYSSPPYLENVAGIWPFRDLWVPCIYTNSSGRLMC